MGDTVIDVEALLAEKQLLLDDNKRLLDANARLLVRIWDLDQVRIHLGKHVCAYEEATMEIRESLYGL